VPLRLGIDIACRAAHQVSLANEKGEFVWTGRRFRTTPQDLAQLWAMLPEGTDPASVLVIMEPTRNAWVPLAAWFRRRGARVVMVPPERSSDLRRYYAKHTKSDRLDSQLLARLPLLHPDGLYAEQGLGPGDALKRAAKLHSTLTHRRCQSLARLDALLEILGPAWHDAIGADLANRTPLKFLAAGYADPHVVKRLGRTRLARFCYRHSRGAWGEPQADALLAAARQTLELWADGDLEYPDLAEDIAIEARLALQLTEEIKDLDERTTLLLKQADPTGILTSAPGVAAITAAAILGRLGDPSRFASLAGARAFTGLVPSLDASGVNGRHGGPTKRGDAVLRQALFMAAEQARRIDPTLAAKYQRLMLDAGKHHNSALCHVATTLLTRLIACWRTGQRYQLRDVDGTPVSIEQARMIIAERYAIPRGVRARRRTTDRTGTDRRSKESLRAPSTGPSKDHATTPSAA
jgi:transposase